MIDAMNVAMATLTLRFMVADDNRAQRSGASFLSKYDWTAITLQKRPFGVATATPY
jgi:hypothetical protein